MSSKAYIVPVNPTNVSSQTAAAANVNPVALWGSLPPSKKLAKVGTSHLFYGAGGGKDVAALVSLGEGFQTKKGDELRETVRRAVGSGVKSVKALGEGVSEAVIDSSADPHAAGSFFRLSSVILFLIAKV